LLQILNVLDKTATRILAERITEEETKTRGKMYCSSTDNVANVFN